MEKLIVDVNKLAISVVNDITILEISDTKTKAAIVSNSENVQDIISGIKAIVALSEESGVFIEKKNDISMFNAGASDAINSGKGAAEQGAGEKLAEEVSKADSWSMIVKIRKAK
ncbi:hypothetical protein [Borrelia hispanica]|uniref:hypothetical protein n=1 Tax=Borrelia hispanica TaxID=40835 RepID=UPI001378FD1D|nr:hypothetical protein [Borrelia hispanica]